MRTGVEYILDYLTETIPVLGFPEASDLPMLSLVRD